MDTERRLKQLTADFPGTPPPDPESLARVVKRGKRAALLHRAGVTGVVAAGLAAVALVVPNVLTPPQPPVIEQPPGVEQDQRLDPAPAETETETETDDHDGGVDDEVVEALPVIEDLPSNEPSPETSANEPTPTEEPRTVTVTAEPKAPEPAPEPKPKPTETTPEPKPTEPKPEPEPTETTPEPDPKPTEALAPYEGFTVSVTASATEYGEGAEPRIIIEACNATEQVREQRHARTGHRYDLWIKNADTGAWVADTTQRSYAQAVETVTWEPGQCREYVEVWQGSYGQVGQPGEGQVPAGNYQVKLKWMGTEGEAGPMDYRYSPTFFLDGPTAPFDGFTVTLSTDKESYGYDEKVTFKIRACNTSGEAREQAIPHAEHWFDLYVKDAAGNVVADTTWREHSGGAVVREFAAGACETWLETWWQCEGQVHSEPTGAHLPAGTYTAKIHWLGSEQGADYGWVNSNAFQLTG